jgi:hypothetical protein
MPAFLVAPGELLAAPGKAEESTAAFLQAIKLDPHYT